MAKITKKIKWEFDETPSGQIFTIQDNIKLPYSEKRKWFIEKASFLKTYDLYYDYECVASFKKLSTAKRVAELILLD